MVSQFKENRQNEEAIRIGLLGSAAGAWSPTRAAPAIPSWLPYAGHCDVGHLFCFESTDVRKHPYGSRYKGTCDGDNLEKAVWDALNQVIWEDDSWISSWSSKKIYWKEDGILLRVRFFE